MEVMSSLLLCAMVAFLPQTQGIQSIRTSKDILFNNTLLIQQKGKHRVLLNLNGQPLVVKISELHNVFSDYHCRNCIDCMERALKAHKLTQYTVGTRPEELDYHRDVLANAIKSHREKRSVNDTKTSGSITTGMKADKKIKNKKQKANKQMTVTKYSVDGEIRALKVKEATTNDDMKTNSMCDVYRISQSYNCNSTDADQLLSELKQSNKNKRIKKDKMSTLPTSSSEVPKTASIFRKREVDNTQLPENIMPSNEEMY